MRQRCTAPAGQMDAGCGQQLGTFEFTSRYYYPSFSANLFLFFFSYIANYPDLAAGFKSAAKGDVEEIERTAGRTEVIVDEGISQAVYPLDESLIDFGTAIDDQDYVHAMDILDKLIITPDVESMWRQLNEVALQAGDLRIAQRCASAIGDVAMRQYLGEVRDLEIQSERETGLRGSDHYLDLYFDAI